MDKLNKFWAWYEYTAYPFGLIALALILGLMARTGAATVTCSVAAVDCAHAYRSEDAIADSMFALIDGNRGQDIVVRPKGK